MKVAMTLDIKEGKASRDGTDGRSSSTLGGRARKRAGGHWAHAAARRGGAGVQSPAHRVGVGGERGRAAATPPRARGLGMGRGVAWLLEDLSTGGGNGCSRSEPGARQHGALRTCADRAPPPDTAPLHPPQLAEYKRHHDEIWPEVRAALEAAGLTNISLWCWPAGGRLFYYAEFVGAEPFDEAMAKYAQAPRIQEWEELMHTYQRQLPGDGGVGGEGGGVWWQPMQRVYSSDF
jgi:L-rhamnose mutarotase